MTMHDTQRDIDIAVALSPIDTAYRPRSDSFDAGRMAERRTGPTAQKLRRLITEAERAARFLEGGAGDVDTARYRARELRRTIADVRMDT